MTARRKKKPRPRQISPRAQVYLVGFGVALAALIWSARGKIAKRPQLAPGAEIQAPITLVGADRGDLACSLEREIDGLHCGFATPERPWPTDNPAQLVAPYMTIDRELFLIAGLFEQSELKARAEADLARTHNRDKQPRFTAHCTLTLVERVRDVRTRWAPSGPWSPASEAWIARPSKCRIE